MAALDDLIASIADELRADPFFAGIDVHTNIFRQDDGEEIFEDKLAASLAEDGVVIGIVINEESMSIFDAGKPLVDPVVKVFINYDPHFAKSSSRISLTSWCEAVAVALHLFVPDTQASCLTPNNTAWRNINEDGVIRCENSFHSQAGLDYTKPTLTDPVIANASNTITISSIPAGSAVYYTTNNEYPGPRTGTLYATPFVITGGEKIKARAWLAGYKGSKLVVLQT
jgi:hypothetical protein